jgi:hypothetical protein
MIEFFSPSPAGEGARGEGRHIDGAKTGLRVFLTIISCSASNSPQDMAIQITITNHAPDSQTIHLLPSLWLEGDLATPTPPSERHKGRNAQWFHLESEDILSMPDKWEYPWFAAWNLAFHAIPIAMINPNQANILTK